MPLSRLALLPVVAVLVGGCALGRFEAGEADPRVPEGPPETIAGPPTGPVHVLASGLTEEAGWRYSVYETADGLCFQMELDQGDHGGGSAGCSAPGEGPPGPISMVGAGGGSGGVGHVEGLAGADVAEIWLRTEDGRTLSGELFALDDVGRQEQAFVVIVPPGIVPSTLVAVDENGDELGTADVPGSGPGTANEGGRPQPPETTSAAS